MLGHGLVTTELRRRQPDSSLGITLNLTPVAPADPADPADVDAARRIDGFQNRVFLDPLLRGSYPEDLLADTAHLGWQDAVHDGDLATIAAPIDVLGINYYTRSVNRHDDGAWPLRASPVRQPLATHTETGWEVRAASGRWPTE